MPKDARERDILERLTAIRDQLLLLKMDRTQYIRTQDVMLLYDQLIEQVKLLNEIRKGQDRSENRRRSPIMKAPHLTLVLTLLQWTRSWRAASSSSRCFL